MSNKQTRSLSPVEQKTIVFYDDELTAVKLENNSVYVPVRRLAENLGLTWPSQRNRIGRDEVLAEEVRSVFITNTDPKSQFTPERSEMLCLPLDLVPGWLFGIQTSRVKEAIRPKLKRYRRECFQVLWDAFKSEILPAVDPALAQPTMEMTPAEQALALAEAVAAMARQQVTLERWLSVHDVRLDATEEQLDIIEGRLDTAAQVVGGHARRPKRIELTLAGGSTVTDAQAAAISEAVKALAYQLGKKEPDRGNPYQRVYSELYRKFRVPSYRALPLESFPAVMVWLTEWWQQVTDETAPFSPGDVGGQLALDQ